MKLTDEQKREIHCVKYGHTPIVTTCFGYIYCARCNNQLGDTLASSYNLDSKIVVDHVGKGGLAGCNCNKNYSSLKPADKKMVPDKYLRLMKANYRKLTTPSD